MADNTLARLLHGRDWGGTGLENLVVIVEDDANLRDNLVYLLKAERIRAIAAPDGMAGQALIRKHRPKVVLIDMYLPHKSGFEVIDDLRGDPILEHIFVIGTSGMAENAEELADMKGRADMMLPKPIDDRSLIDTIRKVFNGSNDTPGLRRHLGGA